METQKQLEEKIIKYNTDYILGESTITDKEYDILLKKLSEFYPDSNLLINGVIPNKSESKKEKLPIPMFSLNKLKNNRELISWVHSFQIGTNFVLSPKYDGISICCSEETTKAWTRGDGFEGQNCQEHLKELDVCFSSENIFTFGEVIMSKFNFIKYKNKFSNQRNLVAGLFNKKESDPSLVDVDFLRYGLFPEKMNKSAQFFYLNKLNKIKIPYVVCSHSNISSSYIEELFLNWGVNYNIDGIVIELDDLILRESLGREKNLNPVYARAIKFEHWNDIYETIVDSVEWNVSKQGKLKPVIIIEPVTINGVTITNVTGYNANYVFEQHICKGSKINIIRSGDVIPKHINTLKYDPNSYFKILEESTKCPTCGFETDWDETHKELICQNNDCEGKKIASIIHFFVNIGVEEFLEASIKNVYHSGYKTIQQILNISKENLMEIDGFAEKSSDNILKQFQKIKQEGVTLPKLLHSLDIFDGKIGEKTASLILNNINKVGDLTEINGVGEKTAEVFWKGWEYYKTNFEGQFKIKEQITKEISPITSQYANYNVCMTGFRDNDLEQKIISSGGNICQSVNKQTTHLIVADLNSNSSKMKKAQELGIIILRREDF